MDSGRMSRLRRLLCMLLGAGVLAFASAVAAQDASGGEGDLCQGARNRYGGAALANGVSVYAMEWTPFDRKEYGWATYLPLIQHELNTDCPSNTPDFAQKLAVFQARFGQFATGQFDAAIFEIFKGVWQERRTFVMARVRGECPDPPPIDQLAYLTEKDEHADRLTRLLRRDVLTAYHRMVADARAEVPELGADPELLQIFSGFRDPEADAARCAADGRCDGLRRALCSAHRTGTAVDLYVGKAADYGVDSTDPWNRRVQAEGPAYRWLVRNAGRYGFTPYVYEPWHWEWIGVPE